MEEYFEKLMSNLPRNGVLKDAAKYATGDGKEIIKLNNLDYLFDSDILILPLDSEANWCSPEWFDIENIEFNRDRGVKIKYYAKNYAKDSATFCTEPAVSSSDSVIFGSVIISTDNGLIGIAEFLKKRYKNSTKINITLYIKNGNELYDKYSFCRTVDKISDCR